ncbi:MAG: hypothetical protein GWO02_02150 [Gammaproteobacteria bacterium]|nr:hypothetical protein [Gammaproteobacteria bacterium]
MPTRRRLAAASLVLTALALPAQGDTMLLEEAIRSTPPNAPGGLERPGGGMTMAQVRDAFGEPQERSGPVGDPPISRWVYDEFVVYFEGERVLHSVVTRGRAEAQ